MKRFSISLLTLSALIAIGNSSCQDGAADSTATDSTADSTVSTNIPSIKGETVDYYKDSFLMKGYVAYDENKKGIRPAVLVLPEWWGVTDYTRRRAKQLAELGYIAFVVDLYGSGKVADNPDSAGAFAKPFYANPQLGKGRFDAALTKLKTYQETDTSKLAAIGYCFGGGQVLNFARLGEPLKAAVSFHGNLTGTPLDPAKLKAAILICHGAADPLVKPVEVDKFKKDMDDAKIPYEFHAYEGAMHAFTNPDATATGEKFKMPVKYDAAADSASWTEMKAFFATKLN